MPVLRRVRHVIGTLLLLGAVSLACARADSGEGVASDRDFFTTPLHFEIGTTRLTLPAVVVRRVVPARNPGSFPVRRTDEATGLVTETYKWALNRLAGDPDRPGAAQTVRVEIIRTLGPSFFGAPKVCADYDMVWARGACEGRPGALPADLPSMFSLKSTEGWRALSQHFFGDLGVTGTVADLFADVELEPGVPVARCTNRVGTVQLCFVGLRLGPGLFALWDLREKAPGTARDAAIVAEAAAIAAFVDLATVDPD